MTRSRILFLLAAVAIGVSVACLAILRTAPGPRILLPFPPGKSCAVGIIDDTDYFQFSRVDPVYVLLDSLGMKVTKTVWTFDASGRDPARVGLSLADPAYREWVRSASEHGHEIVPHSATSGDDDRPTTLAAYDSIRTLVGMEPRLEVFHSSNREALYWGAKRIPDPVLRWFYRRMSDARFDGDEPGSPCYWLDEARGLVRYVRTYTFNEIDTWAVNPSMPYEDSRTPSAPLWFASSNGRTGKDFCALFSTRNVERLKEARGASLVYTHFATGFVNRAGSKELLPETRETLTRCGSDPEIDFVPAGELLDRMRLIQLLADAVEQGRSEIRAPRALSAAFERISAVPDEAIGEQASSIRLPVKDWADARGIRVTWTDGSIFDHPRKIGRLERWRLVVRWLLTQASTPT